MTALLRYQGALLLRSQRWLAPLITYAAFVAVGIRPGDPVPDSLGFAAAGLVPATAWLVRICVTVEPDAARDCTAAAAGPVRVHAAALLTATAGALLAGAAAAAVALPTGDRAGAEPGAAGFAGALAMAACALTGAAVGALSSRPLVRRRGPAVLAGALGSLLALVIAVSPARSAVSALVTAGRSGTVPLPLTDLAGALLLAAGAGTAACLAAARRI
ncbi:ABC transporter [Streptomyces sp. NBC_01233]|uniref:ABC transporter n=1 Tax=Streptomyces sp. NBC_01233 TaxID=2903787 RepID=UPI002E0D822A|nr:ABC transporter [Streptomyces sp. NBC_01233]